MCASGFDSGVFGMRFKLILCVVTALASSAFARDPKPYQTGTLLQMDSVQCGVAGKDAADFGNKNTHDVLCQEYVLQSERVIYRIRPRDEKHPALLPIGERAQFRWQKNKMLLRLESVEGKEHEYSVVSMTPQSDAASADASPVRLNHLQ